MEAEEREPGNEVGSYFSASNRGRSGYEANHGVQRQDRLAFKIFQVWLNRFSYIYTRHEYKKLVWLLRIRFMKFSLHKSEVKIAGFFAFLSDEPESTYLTTHKMNETNVKPP